jgi:hypothetical protein
VHVLCFEKEGDRTIIDERDIHARLKTPCSNRQAAIPKSLNEVGVKLFRLDRRSRLRKGRPVASRAIPVKRELRNNQNLAVDIDYGTIHFSLFIFEYTQVTNLNCESVGVAFVVSFADAEEDTYSASNFANGFTANVDLGFRYPLDDYAHTNCLRRPQFLLGPVQLE